MRKKQDVEKKEKPMMHRVATRDHSSFHLTKGFVIQHFFAQAVVL
jgi:hypothetical protein